MNLNNIRAKNNSVLVSRFQTAPEIAGAIIKAIKESNVIIAGRGIYIKPTIKIKFDGLSKFL